MNLIFKSGPSLPQRLSLALLCSILLIVMDSRLNSFGQVRVFLNTLVSPIQYIATLPGDGLNWAFNQMSTRRVLLSENEALKRENVLMQENLQRYELILKENDELRALLGSPVREDSSKMITELMAVDNNPYSHQIIVDKGAIHGVYEGQPVLDVSGIVGQVQQVASTNSRVLLIADITHAVPTRVMRNGVRVIATGTGDLSYLSVQHMPHSADLVEGDVLVSSGLGGVFPEGYPVATITSVVRDESRPFAQIKAKPVAQLDRLKYLLLLWPANAPKRPIDVEASLIEQVLNKSESEDVQK